MVGPEEKEEKTDGSRFEEQIDDLYGTTEEKEKEEQEDD